NGGAVQAGSIIAAGNLGQLKYQLPAAGNRFINWTAGDGTNFDPVGAVITLKVVPINHVPSFDGSDQNSDENSGPVVVPGWAAFHPGQVQVAGQFQSETGQSALQYTVSDLSNPLLFTAGPTVGLNGDLSYTPTANTFGSSTF